MTTLPDLRFQPAPGPALDQGADELAPLALDREEAVLVPAGAPWRQRTLLFG